MAYGKEYDDTNRGILFKNDKRTKDSQPVWRGSINVEGKEFWISAWKKNTRGGPAISLSVQKKDGSKRPSPSPVQRVIDDAWGEGEDDIPF